MSLAQRNLKTLITRVFEEEQVEAGEFFAKKWDISVKIKN